ncbi:MAG: hypothetical protein ABIR96_11430 [Bdellovibrionota bacterium]
MDTSDAALKQLQERLQRLEKELVSLFDATQEDLRLARALQSQLMPNRIPEMTGLQCQARYISARELSSESYDLIPVHRNRELWIVQSWTSSFGLSSVLLQSLIHTKSVELVQTAQGPSVEKVFDDLTESITAAQKKGSYRLMVAKLDLNKLLLEGVGIGQAPVFARKYEKGILGDISYVEPEPLLKNPALMARAPSTDPISSLRAYRFSQNLEAGSRFFVTGSEWNSGTELADYAKPLDLKGLIGTDTEDNLLANINHLAISMEDHMKAQQKKSDITVIGFELNSRLLHLA